MSLSLPGENRIKDNGRRAGRKAAMNMYRQLDSKLRRYTLRLAADPAARPKATNNCQKTGRIPRMILGDVFRGRFRQEDGDDRGLPSHSSTKEDPKSKEVFPFVYSSRTDNRDQTENARDANCTSSTKG